MGDMFQPKHNFLLVVLKYIFLSDILISQIKARSTSEYLNVIEFVNKNDQHISDSVSNSEAEEVSWKNLKRTNGFAFCLTFMAGFWHGREITLIKTVDNQIKFAIDSTGSNGFIILRESNSSRIQDRMFPFCKPYHPGEWTSVCVSVKLTQQSQKILIYQDGQSCYQKEFYKGVFEWIFLPSKISITQL